MLDPLDRWLLRSHVPEGRRLGPDGFDRLYRLWKARVGLSRYVRHCGYDLHATIAAGGGACPECGAVVDPDAYTAKVDRSL